MGGGEGVWAELEQWEVKFLFGTSGKGQDKFLLNLALSVARYSIWA